MGTESLGAVSGARMIHLSLRLRSHIAPKLPAPLRFPGIYSANLLGQAAWVDRGGGHSGNGGWTDQLGTLASGGPTIIVNGVEEAVVGIKKWMTENAGGSGAGLSKEPAATGLG